jgi:lipopolysaccharide/colanic/teichoic acid biosynthesis glycosyltransferase
MVSADRDARVNGAAAGEARVSGFLDERQFTRALSLERKRTERSGRRFVLMLLDASDTVHAGGSEPVREVLSALVRATRETDIRGWYETGCTMGVVFTEIGHAEAATVVAALRGRISKTLSSILPAEQLNAIRLSFHVFPEPSDQDGPGGPLDLPLYPDVTAAQDPKRAAHIIKRGIDMAGSLTALAVSLPVLLLIAAIIKVTSAGPVLFRQQRVGQYGKRFVFLKFRSMYCSSDHRLHENYTRRLISGDADSAAVDTKPVYKITNDPRVTPFGRFLRRSSLDELPQFLNVLRGEMSLVGPRPPIPYEFECYKTWHKARLLAVKPGITGLWQVGGRSRTTFDEMVRLDLKYARSWSILLDLKILGQTPWAVLSGRGAY